MKKTHLNRALLAISLCLVISSAQATTVTLLDENFDDATNATIASVLTSNPSSLPADTTWSSTSNANAVNLRLGSDAINTYNPGNPLQRFALSAGSNFFLPATDANKFLVMGDDSGQLAGPPTAGTFGFATPFSLPSGTTDITVSFDWVFSMFPFPGTSTPDTDQFVVGITGNGYNVTSPMIIANSIVNQSITSGGKYYGPANMTILASNLGAPDSNGKYWLNFGYFEAANTNNNNGAVGIDNIKITANVAPVPVPAAVWLFGSALMGFVGLQKRKQLA